MVKFSHDGMTDSLLDVQAKVGFFGFCLFDIDILVCWHPIEYFLYFTLLGFSVSAKKGE